MEQSKTDLKISWQMYKSNYKAFIATELFAIFAFFLINIALALLLVAIYAFSPNLEVSSLFSDLTSRLSASHILRVIVASISFLVMVGFLNCQYGLAYDIFSSGDMFAEFKSSFTYFKRHWWQYIILIFITGLGMFVPNRSVDNDPPRFLENVNILAFQIARFIVLLLFLILFSSTLPSVTAQGNLIKSFNESFRIVRKDTKRLVKTWSIYFLIFFAPLMIFSITLTAVFSYIEGTFWIPLFYSIILAIYLVIFFVGFPMMSLIATRIYNDVDIKREKPIVQKSSTSKTTEQKQNVSKISLEEVSEDKAG